MKKNPASLRRSIFTKASLLRRNHMEARPLLHSLPAWFVLFLVAILWSQRAYLYFLVPSAFATAGTATFSSSAGAGGNVYGNIFYDHDNTAFLIDPNATGTSASMAGTLSIGNGGFLRTNYGPLNLQYKSALDTWATALTVQDTTGNVGIGTTGPGQKLSVAGTVESTTGGFKFPDATTQTTAAGNITTTETILTSDFTATRFQWVDVTGLNVSLAAGTWIIMAQVSVYNSAGDTNGRYGSTLLTDGTTTFASSETDCTRATGSCTNAVLVAKVSPGSTTTYKVQIYDQGGSLVVKASGGNFGAAKATKIVAIKTS